MVVVCLFNKLCQEARVGLSLMLIDPDGFRIRLRSLWTRKYKGGGWVVCKVQPDKNEKSRRIEEVKEDEKKKEKGVDGLLGLGD